MMEKHSNNEDSNMLDNVDNKTINDGDAMDIDEEEGFSESLTLVKNRNQSHVEKKIEKSISINDKRQKYGKRVRFAIDDNIEPTYRIGRIDELNSKHKDCRLNNLNTSEVDATQNIKIQQKMLCFDRYSDNDVEYTEYPSKHRHLNFTRFNFNESKKKVFDCNIFKEYPFVKGTKNTKENEENLEKAEEQFPIATLSNNHLSHRNELRIDGLKYSDKVESSSINESINKDNYNSRNENNATTLGSNTTLPTTFELNGSIGSKLFEEGNHSASILNITVVKSNLDRIIKRYQMKKKQTKDDSSC